MIYYKHGNLLDAEEKYICHQVNCMGAMNSGVAKQIRDKWPQVYENYCKKVEANSDNPALMLGDIQIVPLYDDYEKDIYHKGVINLFSQYKYGYDGQRYTSYDAFFTCLQQIKRSCAFGDFAFPYCIGSDRGGASWPIIEKMIETVFYDRNVYIYYLSEVDLSSEDRRKIENDR